MHNFADKRPIAHSFIRFYPHLKKQFGSNEPVLLIDRLEYWFNFPKFRSGFFKFLEPCQHQLYRPGDSWEEEVGLSRRAFNNAFDIIGVRYGSKSAFLSAEDPFQGKPYASYHDRQAHRMVYVRNHEFADLFLKSLFQRKVKEDTRNEKGRGGGSKINHNCRYSNDTKCRSPIIEQRNTTNSSSESKSEAQTAKAPSDIEQLAEGMKKIWIEEIGDVGIAGNSTSLTKRLYLAFKNLFGESLERWRKYCRKIASSKFLMGEARNSNFKIWLTWAIKPEAVERIGAGEYREDRTSQRALEEDRELSRTTFEKKRIEAELEGLESEMHKKRTKKVQNSLASLPKNEIDQLKSSFESNLDVYAPGMALPFKEQGWKTPFIEPLFYGFLADVFLGKLEEDEKYLERKKVLRERIEEIGRGV